MATALLRRGMKEMAACARSDDRASSAAMPNLRRVMLMPQLWQSCAPMRLDGRRGSNFPMVQMDLITPWTHRRRQWFCDGAVRQNIFLRSLVTQICSCQQLKIIFGCGLLPSACDRCLKHRDGAAQE